MIHFKFQQPLLCSVLSEAAGDVNSRTYCLPKNLGCGAACRLFMLVILLYYYYY
ncbi:hypothetical protein HanIR_Chr09g0400021 [Helianthus annuus]|nr:hypothetical protein HanIR_Chr09g0400021 [Helianthus annuus]